MIARDLLESDAMRAFATFARHRNFTSAAAELHISQPSLHVKIGKLAASLGVELYRREGRTLALTDAGRRLAGFAEESLRKVDDILVDLDQQQRVIRLAAGPGTLRWIISPAIRAITRSGQALHLITANREAALASLTSGEADVAVVAFAPPPTSLRSRQIASYPQILVVGKNHPLGQRDRIRLADLHGLDLLVPPEGRPHRRAIDLALDQAGVSWQVVAEVDGWDLLVHFADIGLGATIVNGCVRLPARLRAIPIADLPRVRYWLTWRAQQQTSIAGVLKHLGTA